MYRFSETIITVCKALLTAYPPKPLLPYIYIYIYSNSLLSFNYFFKSISSMMPLSLLAGWFAHMPVLSKLQIIRSSQMKNAFKYVIIKRWFVAFGHPSVAFGHPSVAFSRPIMIIGHPKMAFGHPSVAFRHPIVTKMHLIMAIKRLFMAFKRPSVIYVDPFVMYGKLIATYQDTNSTYIFNNNSLLFTNHLKQKTYGKID